jgi:addiction module RelE/StbE family toxin
MRLIWSKRFVRDLKRLVRRNQEIMLEIEKTLQQLSEDSFHPSLKTHKLKGDLTGVWACSINYSNRILFEFVEDSEAEEEAILLHTVGSHDDVY